MAIIFPLSLPTRPGHVQVTFSQRSSIAISESPWTFQSQVQEHQGQAWEANIELPTMRREDAEEWMTFILKLNGSKGTFMLGDPLGAQPRGLISGTPVVEGAGQKGSILNTIGWATNAFVKAGDYVQLGNRLYKIMQDVSADGAGRIQMDIWPRLRESPFNGQFLTMVTPKGLFRLSKNYNQIYTSASFEYYSISLEAREAL